MKLTIGYKSGEQRVINLHPDFFTSTPDESFNHRSNRVEKHILTPSDKAVILAGSLGAYPYSIVLERSGQMQLKKINLENLPIKVAKVEKIDEKDLKKALKK